MKTRVGFVSNSSSSSFLCTVKPKHCMSIKLEPKEALKAIRLAEFQSGNSVAESEAYYVTEFISDSSAKYDRLLESPHCFEFISGSQNLEPYQGEDLCHIKNGVYLPRDD